MQRTKKAVIVGGALAAALLTLAPVASYAGGGWRHGHDGDGRPGCSEEMRGKGGFFHGQMERERDLTEAEIRKVAEAMMLMHGNDNLKVGDITDGDEGYYKVQIVTEDNSPVVELQLDKRSGHPMRGQGRRK